MNKNSIQVLCEDLTEEFQALARTHTTAIGTLLEEFNDDQLLLTIETKVYGCERLRAEKGELTSVQASTEV